MPRNGWPEPRPPVAGAFSRNRRGACGAAGAAGRWPSCPGPPPTGRCLGPARHGAHGRERGPLARRTMMGPGPAVVWKPALPGGCFRGGAPKEATPKACLDSRNDDASRISDPRGLPRRTPGVRPRRAGKRCEIEYGPASLPWSEPMDDDTRTALEAAAFRTLVAHLRERPDVQNIDLMNLAGFCRNCLSKWYRAAAEERGGRYGLRRGARDRVWPALRGVEGPGTRPRRRRSSARLGRRATRAVDRGRRPWLTVGLAVAPSARNDPCGAGSRRLNEPG